MPSFFSLGGCKTRLQDENSELWMQKVQYNWRKGVVWTEKTRSSFEAGDQWGRRFGKAKIFSVEKGFPGHEAVRCDKRKESQTSKEDPAGGRKIKPPISRAANPLSLRPTAGQQWRALLWLLFFYAQGLF